HHNMDVMIGDLKIFLSTRNMKQYIDKNQFFDKTKKFHLNYDIQAWLNSLEALDKFQCENDFIVYLTDETKKYFYDIIEMNKNFELSLQIIYRDGTIMDFWPIWKKIEEKIMTTNDPINLCIILARGGSKGVPRKNILLLNNKPILTYTINDARESTLIDKIVISTEDSEIAQVSKDYGAKVIMRPAEYATDNAPMDLALRYTVRELKKTGVNINIVVPLYANVPVRKKGIIDCVIEKLISTGADSVQTYSPCQKPPQWACKIIDDKPSLLESKHNDIFRRQEFEPAYFPNGSAMAVRYDVLMDEKNISKPDGFLGTDRRAVVVENEFSVDIDEPIDLLYAKFQIEWLNKDNKK
ncbi:Acylneuraminate cytidylyltransferase, partial [Candidatus Magnetomorum sp. HK-1]